MVCFWVCTRPFCLCMNKMHKTVLKVAIHIRCLPPSSTYSTQQPENNGNTSLKTFFLSAKLVNICTDTSLTNRYFRVLDTIQMPCIIVKHLKFRQLCFQNKAHYQTEYRPANISSKCLLPDEGKTRTF